MAMIIAVLEKRVGYFFGNLDAYLNVVGGLKLDEPAADLAVAAALVSSLVDRPVDEKALVSVLNEPKNSLVKQYKKLFEFDGVLLEFEDDALKNIAKEAIKRNTGARGLRAIIEEIMQETMFEVPSLRNVEKVVVTKKASLKTEKPVIIKKETKKQISS